MSKKTYLVSGASRGIGFEIALDLLKTSDVIAVSRSKSGLDLLKENGAKCIQTDITSTDDLLELNKYLKKSEIYLDGIVNNAGYLINKPFLEQTEDDWFKTFQVNTFGPANLIKVLYSRLNDNAHIVNVSSMGGYLGSSKYPGLSSYASSKGAL